MNANIPTARIVVGVDGSPSSREALRWAGELARVLDGRVVAVHGLGVPGRRASRPDQAQRRYEEITELELEWCQELVRAGIPFSTAVRTGCPIEVMSAVADQHKAGLVVVGNRGTGSTPPGGLGRTTWRMLQHGRQPVLVVPEQGAGAHHLGLRNIVVGFDGSAASEWVLEAAGEMAVAFDSRVTFVRALESHPYGPPHERVDARLPQVAGRLSDRGIAVQAVIRRGDAADVIHDTVASLDSDLVAVGARRDGALTAEPGSVTRCLLHKTLRPTLVAPSRGAQRRARSLASGPRDA